MSVSIATEEIEKLVDELQEIRAIRKALQVQEDKLREKLECHMGDSETLSTIDGEELLRWKYSVPPMKFDVKAFREQLPNIYKHYVTTGEPVRRLIINVK